MQRLREHRRPLWGRPTHTVHRAELVAVQAALRARGRRQFPHRQSGGDGWHSQLHAEALANAKFKYRDLLRDIVSRLAARCKNGLRTTIAKVAAHSGIAADERADGIAKRAVRQYTITDHTQPLGNRPFSGLHWLQTYEYMGAEDNIQAMAGQIPEADRLSPGDRAAGLASRPPSIVRRHVAELTARGLQPQCHRRRRTGGSNMRTVYVSAWRAANVGLHGGLSNSVIWEAATSMGATALVLKAVMA